MKRTCLVCCILALVLLGGCGEKAPPASEISSVPTPPPPPEVIPLVLPEGDIPEGTAVAYTWDYPITVDSGRTLTLRLECEVVYTGWWRYGVRAIHVLEGDALVQTLSVLEADTQSCAQEGIDTSYALERTYCWSEDGDLTIEDLNFDGIPDLRLLESTGTVNSVYLCWLWDAEEGQFRYAFSLGGYDVTVDPEREQIVTIARDSGPEGTMHITSYYRYDEDGILQLADTDVEIPTMG